MKEGKRKYNMKVSMSEVTKGISKKLSLSGCLNRWVVWEQRKIEKMNNK